MSKKIELSDSDYDSLMELCKEMQTQENDCQAHPYYWEPRSSKPVQSPNEEGELMFGYDDSSSTPENMWDDSYFEDNKAAFLEGIGSENAEYLDIEDEWIDFIESDPNFTKWYQVIEQQTEHNPSLFKSDVKGFIEGNKHHLGKDPHTYANTIWRMPKMIKLVSILCRINKQENADNEIKAKCHKGD